MVDKVINVEAQTVSFKFEDETVQTVEVSKLDPAMVVRLVLHGISQKCGDSYAGANKEPNPLAFAKASVAEVIKQLFANEWRAPRSGDGGPRVSDLALAVARVTGKTIEEIVGLLDVMEDEEKKVLRAKPKVALALNTIKAEKLAAKQKELLAAAGEDDSDVI